MVASFGISERGVRGGAVKLRNMRVLAMAVLAALGGAGHALGSGYEAPTSDFGMGTYYSGVTGGLTGDALRLQLHGIISANFVGISYGDARMDLPIMWTDPTNSLNMILVYDHTSIVKPTGGSIPGWEGANGVLVWNREHIWPQSWLGISVSNTYVGPGSDIFELAPASVTTNGGRGNDGYGNVTTSGAPAVNGSYFYPGDTDKGDIARSLFYMATRYYTGNATLSIQNLQLINGSVYSTFQMGDLQSLLHYNYEDGVDNFERQRNETAQSLQGNRNPFIDHPEYVWAIFGFDASGNRINNSSQISVNTPDANGNSSATVSLGRVMVNGTLGTGNVTVNKTGATPTTFDITTSGNATTILGGATSLAAGTGQPFDYGNVTKTMTVGLNASTTTAGLKSGTVTIHNTDLTTAGAGQGSADGNDTVNITAAVLNKRTVTAGATLNFGTVITGANVSGNVALSTTGDDNTFTRVNVAGTAAADANSIGVSGTATLFNTNGQTTTRTLAGTLTTVGNTSGNFSLAVTTAENNGAGLTGEGTYASLGIGYSATVLAHADGSLSSAADTHTLTLNFGVMAKGSADPTLPISISNLVATAGFTAGLDLNSVAVSGSTALSTNVAGFSNLAAGSSQNFAATLATDSTGKFSTTYTLNVADQNLPGATTLAPLTVTLTGDVAIEGDVNEDGTVNIADLNVVAAHWQDSTTSGWSDGDLNGDGIINIADLNLLAANWQAVDGGGSGVGSLTENLVTQFAAVATPEPGTLAIIALAWMGLAVRRKRPL